MRQAIVVVLLVGAASLLAHLHVVAQAYYPVVRVESPEGLTFIAVHEPTSERAACGAANQSFLAPFKAMCKDCRIVAARCERELQGAEAALNAGSLALHHRVFAPGLRMAIAGPREAAALGCRHIAEGLEAQGIPSVVCLSPQS